MKSIDISAPRACGRADTANASMLNAKRIFFIVVSNVRCSTFPPRDLFNFKSQGASAPRVFRPHAQTFTMNGHEFARKRIRREREWSDWEERHRRQRRTG